MTAPWEPDRSLSTDGAAAAINSRFPDLDTGNLKFLGSGWEFDAWITTDGWVFRFPRRAESSGLFEQERQIHDLVSRFLSPAIGIPHAELFGDPAAGFPYPIVAHRYIPGIPADEADERLRPVMAREIGQALGAVHSIPVGAARAAGVEEMEDDEDGRNRWFQPPLEVLTALRGRDSLIDRAVDWTRQVSLPTTRSDGPLRFIHHDLSPEHLLVDRESGRLTGILDWTDAIIGDAARDFVFLVAWRGWEFAEEVLGYYPHPVDPGFRERLRFMSRVLTVAWLGYAHARGTEVDKLTTWVHNAFAPCFTRLPGVALDAGPLPERPMIRVRREDLPFRGSSLHFVGADHGDVNASVFLFRGLPGSGPKPHTHPYDEIQFIQEGRGLWTVNGEEFEAGAGDILVIKAGEVHGFRCIGDGPLVQLDVHLSPRFIQEYPA